MVPQAARGLAWALCLSGAAASPYCDADFEAGGTVVETSGSAGFIEFDMPHRVSVTMILVFIVFYTVVMGLMQQLYRCLRKAPAREYALVLEQAKIDGEADGSWQGPSKEKQLWWLTDLAQIHVDNGLDAALYLRHTQQMAMYCGGNFCLMGIILLIVYIWGGEYESGLSMFAWSYANLNNQGEGVARFVPVLGAWWSVASIVLFTIWKQKSMDEFKSMHDEDGTGSTSLYTIWIKGLPAMTQNSGGKLEDEMAGFLEEHFSGQVASAKLAWDVNELGHNLRARRQLIAKANKLSDQEDDMSGEKVLLRQATISSITERIKMIASHEPRLRSQPLTCAGSAFVTFNSPVDCQQFKNDMQKDTFPVNTKLNTSSWTCQNAPKPSEIYWENFGLSKEQQRQNFVKTFLYTLGMYAAFVFVALGAVWCIGFDYMYFLYGLPGKQWARDFICVQKTATGPFVWYGVIALFFIITFLILEEEMAPIIKFISKFDSPKTKSIKQSTYLGKCYWFYVIYHLVLSTTVLGFLSANVIIDPDVFIDERHGMVKLYVEAIGAFHQHRVFLTVCIIDMIHVLDGKGFFTRKVHELTPEEANKFESAEEQEQQLDEHKLDRFFDDKFDFTRNYGETIGVFTSICYYQVMHPTILICGGIYYSVKFFVDKYQITNQYSKPRVQYGRRARTTTAYLFWAMSVGQIGNVVYFMFLIEDTLVGSLMMLSMVVSFGILLVYIYKPAAMKQQIGHKMKEAKEAKKLERAVAKDKLTGEGETETFPEAAYNPPRPEDMRVGLTLRAPHASKAVVLNPMLKAEVADEELSDTSEDEPEHV